jgi:hypothetical protein
MDIMSFIKRDLYRGKGASLQSFKNQLPATIQQTQITADQRGACRAL